jgi:hypothetical protein
VDYLRNQLLDRTQIFSLGLDGQTIFKNSLNEKVLKILEVKYLSIHLLDHTPIETIFYKSLNKDNIQWKTPSKF